MFNFLRASLSDVDGQTSSKRVIAYALLLILGTMAITDTFTIAHFKADTWDDVFYGLLLYGGMITSEKFTKRSIRKTPDNETSTSSTTPDSESVVLQPKLL